MSRPGGAGAALLLVCLAVLPAVVAADQPSPPQPTQVMLPPAHRHEAQSLPADPSRLHHACPPELAAATAFTDVAATNPHSLSIDCVIGWHVANGTSGSTYHPGGLVSRQQMAAFLARLVVRSGAHLPPATRDHFGDDNGLPHEEAINRLAGAGLVSGSTPAAFAPTSAVSRGQMASLLVRAVAHVSGSALTSATDRFADDDGSVHEAAINAAAEAGIVRGAAPGAFHPADPVRRDQMASFLAGALGGLVRDGHASLPDPTGHPHPDMPSHPTQPPPPSQGCTQTLSGTVRKAAVTVPDGEVWCFDPSRDVILEASGNVVVRGTLRMRPSAPGVTHTLRFVGVDEEAFVGGGMRVATSDVGLWVMGSGVLDARGAAKTAWTRLAGGANRGTATINVIDAAGWQVGDEVAITPTSSPASSNHASAYDERRIVAVSRNMVTLDAPLSHDHPAVEVKPGTVLTAEVLNLTRNVRIEGTPPRLVDCRRWVGRAHVMVMSGGRQTISHVALRYLGPRRVDPKYADLCRGVSQRVLGRYGLHFHHVGDLTAGTVVEGVVARDLGNWGFVPHSSHGITFRNNVVHATHAEGFVWDKGFDTHRLTWERNLVSLVDPGEAAVGEHYAAGFVLGEGDGNVAVGNVAVGINQGSFGGGYLWNKDDEGIWTFADNLTHNSTSNGAAFWINTSNAHTFDGFTAYYNSSGFVRGAYLNPTRLTGFVGYGNRHAQFFGWAGTACDPAFVGTCPPQDAIVVMEDTLLDGAGVGRYGMILAGRTIADGKDDRGIIRDTTIRGWTERAVKFTFDYFDRGPYPVRWLLDGVTFVGDAAGRFLCTDDIHQGSTLEVGDGAGTSYTLRRSDQAGIPDPGTNCSRR